MKVLAYKLTFDKMNAAVKASKAVGAELVNLKAEDLHRSIGNLVDDGTALTGGPVVKGIRGETVVRAAADGLAVDACAEMDSKGNAGEILILDGLSGEQLDGFLAAYNATGAPKVPYKAMVTPFNRSWSPAYLYDQLVEESKQLT